VLEKIYMILGLFQGIIWWLSVRKNIYDFRVLIEN
jgi:hypothetical protein